MYRMFQNPCQRVVIFRRSGREYKLLLSLFQKVRGDEKGSRSLTITSSLGTPKWVPDLMFLIFQTKFPKSSLSLSLSLSLLVWFRTSKVTNIIIIIIIIIGNKRKSLLRSKGHKKDVYYLA